MKNWSPSICKMIVVLRCPPSSLPMNSTQSQSTNSHQVMTWILSINSTVSKKNKRTDKTRLTINAIVIKSVNYWQRDEIMNIHSRNMEISLFSYKYARSNYKIKAFYYPTFLGILSSLVHPLILVTHWTGPILGSICYDFHFLVSLLYLWIPQNVKSAGSGHYPMIHLSRSSMV